MFDSTTFERVRRIIDASNGVLRVELAHASGLGAPVDTAEVWRELEEAVTDYLRHARGEVGTPLA